MIDLKTNYLGLQLRTPLCFSLTAVQEIDSIRHLEDAVHPPWCCTHSLRSSCAGKHRTRTALDRRTDSFSEASSFFPSRTNSVWARRISESHPSGQGSCIYTVIASLNGTTLALG